MEKAERSIRELIAAWHRATAEGDVDAVLRLMADDVIFLTPGNPPMQGKEAFAKGLKEVLNHARIDSDSEIREIYVAGEWAYCWTHITVNMIPLHDGSAIRRTGDTLTVLRRNSDGEWVVYRDANMLAA